jgi:glycerol-3-phosphate dehydrogenase
VIAREPARVAATRYELLVVGGGIHGAMVALQAAQLGLRTCVMEARDFGSGTSWNSLRILHGGLRYLQSVDLPRFFESVAARRWYARAFPTLVRPIRCLMPLYAQGLKRRSVMRAALAINDLLGSSRNYGVRPELRLSVGRTLDARATRAHFPLVRDRDLEGAAEWTDYFMISSERVLIETLRRACRHGADVLNYTRVLDVLVEDGRVAGVRARDELLGDTFDVAASQVLNCAGPEIRTLAHGRGRTAQSLFRPSMAFNLLLDARLPTESAVAVAAPRPGAPVLFLIPQQGTVLAGTCHLPRPADTVSAEPTANEIDRFLEDIRTAVPGLTVSRQHVCRVFAGLLPVRAPETAELTSRAVVHDHASDGGPAGLISVAGVKFTTAPRVAAAVLQKLRPGAASSRVSATPDPAVANGILTDARQLSNATAAALRDALLRTIHEESVQTPDDLVLRRTNWATTEVDLGRCYDRVAAVLGDAAWQRIGAPRFGADAQGTAGSQRAG